MYTLFMALESHDPSMYTLSVALEVHDPSMYTLSMGVNEAVSDDLHDAPCYGSGSVHTSHAGY